MEVPRSKANNKFRIKITLRWNWGNHEADFTFCGRPCAENRCKSYIGFSCRGTILKLGDRYLTGIPQCFRYAFPGLGICGARNFIRRNHSACELVLE